MNLVVPREKPSSATLNTAISVSMTLQVPNPSVPSLLKRYGVSRRTLSASSARYPYEVTALRRNPRRSPSAAGCVPADSGISVEPVGSRRHPAFGRLAGPLEEIAAQGGHGPEEVAPVSELHPRAEVGARCTQPPALGELTRRAPASQPGGAELNPRSARPSPVLLSQQVELGHDRLWVRGHHVLGVVPVGDQWLRTRDGRAAGGSSDPQIPVRER